VRSRFGIFEFDGASVGSDGVYHSAYLEDADLQPIIEIPFGNGSFWMYPMAIVALPEGDTHFIGRMD